MKNTCIVILTTICVLLAIGLGRSVQRVDIVEKGFLSIWSKLAVSEDTINDLNAKISEQQALIAKVTKPITVNNGRFEARFPPDNQDFPNYAKIEFRSRLSRNWNRYYSDDPDTTEDVIGKQLQEKISNIDGITLVSVDQYTLEIHKARMFTWPELKDQILAILEAEFPASPEPTSTPAMPLP